MFADDAPSPAFLPKRESTLPEVIEKLGTGPAQFRMTLLSSPVWFADGAELLLISSVTKAVSNEWDLSSIQRGVVVSLVFIGIFFGNLLSGPIGDEYGRRLPILCSFLLIFVFSMLSACTWNFWSLSFARFLVGLSIGIGQPAQQAMVSETTPTKWRVVFTGAGMIIFAMGEIYSGLLILADDPEMKTLHWRLLLIAGAVPIALFGVLAVLFLHQSPLYLACGGRYEETQVVLESMRHDNSAPQVSIDFKPHRALCGGSAAQNALTRQLNVIFSQSLLVTTLVLGYCCFVMNLCYYGSLYAFPQVMQGGVQLGSSPGVSLIMGAIVEMIGNLMSVVMILYLHRLPMMRTYLFSCAVSLSAFAIGGEGRTPLTKVVAIVGYYGVKLCVPIGFQIYYLYATEVYPTMARATGTSLVCALGRLASTIAPVVYETLMSLFDGQFSVFFWLMAVLCAVNFPLISLFPKETYGVVLKDELSKDDEEAEEAAPSCSGQPLRHYGSTAAPGVERAA